MNICEYIEDIALTRGKAIREMSAQELYEVLSIAARARVGRRWNTDAKKGKDERRAYYFSAEFLVGRVITSNLLNMGELENVTNLLKREGVDINILEDIDDCALGNGGLGRLAACFLDSAATHSHNLDGYGIRYKYGLFRQRFVGGFQTEEADDWTKFGDPWSERKYSERVTVDFCGQSVYAVPYDMPIIGYGAGARVNTLRLWQAEAIESFDFGKFNSDNYDGAVSERVEAERITQVLYPNDNAMRGKILRLKQQYFFSSASLKDIIRKGKAEGKSILGLADTVAAQLNDTHPVIAIPEYIRLAIEDGASFSEAFCAAQKIFSYTNHTVMSEALEKWDNRIIKKLLPDVYKVIKLINAKLIDEVGKNAVDVKIIDGKMTHMARLACFVAHSINGVAKIHTEIIKAVTLNPWFKLYPTKFYNMTNGITQRRWLALANPRLAAFITSRIGDGWLTNLDLLEGLSRYENDAVSLKEFAEIKTQNKRDLANFIFRREGIKLDESFIFDIQIKRLHEYKRQLMNAFSIEYIYRELKSGALPNFKPTVFIFGAKAAPGYARAKGIIKYINEIAAKINTDVAVADKIKVVFVTDYNVSYAEKLVAAGDVSEQISAAGTEASGTGNMKLMLNGAVTLGTYDGANIEIAEAAGEQNNYIFGARVEELKAISASYKPSEILAKNEKLNAVVSSLIDGAYSDGGSGIFAELYSSILVGASWHKADNYFILKDLQPYINAKIQVNSDYGSLEFVKKCLANTTHAGRFSSDRTVNEYAKEIWKIK